MENGRWYGRIRKNGHEITITADTKTEAQEKLDHAAKRLGAKQWDRTLTECATQWLDNKKWSENTKKAYTDRANRLVLPYLGQTKLSQIDAPKIRDTLTQAETDGHTPGNIRLIYETLAIILSYAKKQGYIALNPVTQVDKPQIEKRKPDPLTPTEVDTILTWCQQNDNKYFTFYALTISMGLRSGEARLAKKEHIKDGFLHIPRENTKTAAGERDVPVTEWLTKAMNNPAGQHDSEYIVPSDTPGPLNKTTISKAWKRLLEHLQIPHRRIHDCRHTCGSLLAAKGVPPRVIQQVLGHSSETMANHYSQQTKETMLQAMANAL